MRIFVTLFLVFNFSLYAAEVVKLSKKYQSSQKCIACHQHIAKDWKNSWHAKSHYNKDEYYRKSIDYLSRKTRESQKTIEVKCAKCHNPRISVTKVNDDFEVVAALGLEKGSKIDKALKDKTISEGINCLVCHNVNHINTKAPANVRGMDRVSWNKNGTMSGPFNDAKSPYHKTQQRKFFTKDPNQLCFVCHANEHSYINKNLIFTNMEKEYKGNQKCVECHMSPKVHKYAATYRYNGKLKPRDIRYHKFDGAHKEQLWKNALQLSLKDAGDHLLITIKNPQPHNIPSGFGGREILVQIEYYHGDKETKTVSLTTYYKRKRGKKSIPHSALKASKNLSIPAKGSKTIKVTKPQNISKVKVTLYYKLVNDEIHLLLKLKEDIWQKKFFITSKEIKF